MIYIIQVNSICKMFYFFFGRNKVYREGAVYIKNFRTLPCFFDKFFYSFTHYFGGLFVILRYKKPSFE